MFLVVFVSALAASLRLFVVRLQLRFSLFASWLGLFVLLLFLLASAVFFCWRLPSCLLRARSVLRVILVAVVLVLAG